MSAYLIFTRERTKDQAEMDIYAKEAPPTAVGHPITMLARYGEFEVLEGDSMEGSVVMEFPTVAEAKAYYNSPGYQAAALHRFKGADYRVFVTQGV